MKPINQVEINIQRNYYRKTASSYDNLHLNSKDEHYFALSIMAGVIDFLGISTILDIGSGTGRAIEFIKKRYPDVKIIGIEPVLELREIGYRKGISKEELIDGDVLSLQFKDNSFDMVCEFGVLHHIEIPDIAVAEMLRVAQKAVFISDSNNYGQGSILSRSLKQLLHKIGLWSLANTIKTKGKGYKITEGDGLAYSYSVFNNYKQIREKCSRVHLMNTKDGSINPYKTASHVVLLGILK